MKRPFDSAARSHAVYAVVIGLRGNAIATAGPILILRVCSAAIASGRKPSLPASIDQIASKPSSSALRASAATSVKSRVAIPLSSFMDRLPQDSMGRIVTEENRQKQG